MNKQYYHIFRAFAESLCSSIEGAAFSEDSTSPLEKPSTAASTVFIPCNSTEDEPSSASSRGPLIPFVISHDNASNEQKLVRGTSITKSLPVSTAEAAKDDLNITYFDLEELGTCLSIESLLHKRLEAEFARVDDQGQIYLPVDVDSPEIVESLRKVYASVAEHQLLNYDSEYNHIVDDSFSLLVESLYEKLSRLNTTFITTVAKETQLKKCASIEGSVKISLSGLTFLANFGDTSDSYTSSSNFLQSYVSLKKKIEHSTKQKQPNGIFFDDYSLAPLLRPTHLRAGINSASGDDYLFIDSSSQLVSTIEHESSTNKEFGRILGKAHMLNLVEGIADQVRDVPFGQHDPFTLSKLSFDPGFSNGGSDMEKTLAARMLFHNLMRSSKTSRYVALLEITPMNSSTGGILLSCKFLILPSYAYLFLDTLGSCSRYFCSNFLFTSLLEICGKQPQLGLDDKKSFRDDLRSVHLSDLVLDVAHSLSSVRTQDLGRLFYPQLYICEEAVAERNNVRVDSFSHIIDKFIKRNKPGTSFSVSSIESEKNSFLELLRLALSFNRNLKQGVILSVGGSTSINKSFMPLFNDDSWLLFNYILRLLRIGKLDYLRALNTCLSEYLRNFSTVSKSSFAEYKRECLALCILYAFASQFEFRKGEYRSDGGDVTVISALFSAIENGFMTYYYWPLFDTTKEFLIKYIRDTLVHATAVDFADNSNDPNSPFNITILRRLFGSIQLSEANLLSVAMRKCNSINKEGFFNSIGITTSDARQGNQLTNKEAFPVKSSEQSSSYNHSEEEDVFDTQILENSISSEVWDLQLPKVRGDGEGRSNSTEDERKSRSKSSSKQKHDEPITNASSARFSY